MTKDNGDILFVFIEDKMSSVRNEYDESIVVLGGFKLLYHITV